MKIVIDFDLCQGHAMCMDEDPDVFEVDDQGFLTVLMEEPPAEHHAAVKLAAKYCPTGAIRLQDD